MSFNTSYPIENIQTSWTFQCGLLRLKGPAKCQICGNLPALRIQISRQWCTNIETSITNSVVPTPKFLSLGWRLSVSGFCSIVSLPFYDDMLFFFCATKACFTWPDLLLDVKIPSIYLGGTWRGLPPCWNLPALRIQISRQWFTNPFPIFLQLTQGC